jgi:hypothetical protein
MLARRRILPELLDHAAPEVARENLADLVRINSHFGGHSTIRTMLSRSVGDQEKFTLLDVAAASGDTGRLIKSLYPGATVVNLDYNPVNRVLPRIRKLSPTPSTCRFQPGVSITCSPHCSCIILKIKGLWTCSANCTA